MQWYNKHSKQFQIFNQGSLSKSIQSKISEEKGLNIYFTSDLRKKKEKLVTLKKKQIDF